MWILVVFNDLWLFPKNYLQNSRRKEFWKVYMPYFLVAGRILFSTRYNFNGYLSPGLR
jgi:hypothetical protein